MPQKPYQTFTLATTPKATLVEKWCSRIAKKLIAHGVNLSVLEGHLVAESWGMAETFRVVVVVFGVI